MNTYSENLLTQRRSANEHPGIAALAAVSEC
jgi:hypothetical protein